MTGYGPVCWRSRSISASSHNTFSLLSITRPSAVIMTLSPFGPLGSRPVRRYSSETGSSKNGLRSLPTIRTGPLPLKSAPLKEWCCIYATRMVGDLVARSRARAGLSCRALATKAGVTASTVTRIERGEMEPTVAMLDRLTTAAGSVLVVTEVPTVAGLATRLRDPGIDWVAVRLFTDWVQLHPWHTTVAIDKAPDRSGSARLECLLAAIAEKLADDAGVKRPAWTGRIAPLTEPWEHPGTPAMRTRSRERAPRQFADRNIWLDGIWR